MRRTNKRRTKNQRKRGSYVSRKRRSRVKKFFSVTEKTTEPNIMVKQASSGGIISGLRSFLGKKSI